MKFTGHTLSTKERREVLKVCEQVTTGWPIVTRHGVRSYPIGSKVTLYHNGRDGGFFTVSCPDKTIGLFVQ